MASATNIEQTEEMSKLLGWINGIDMPMFVVRLMPCGQLEFVDTNDAVARMCNVPRSAFRGQIPSKIFPVRTSERLEANYRICLSKTAPFSYEECLLIDGRETWWQTTLCKPEGFDGTVILGLSCSITDAKDREFSSARALADLSERFDELRLFSTMAAHDARSPLATVSSLIDLVLDDFEDRGDGKVELLAMASNTVQEALSQITSTLERARQLNAEKEVRKTVDLGRLCGDIAAMVDPEMHLAIEVPQTRVECDEVMVQMGVRNLMSNAARFCEHHITVRVSANAAKDLLAIEVADDGPGLPEGMSLNDLIRAGEARDGEHGFGLNAIAKLASSRGGSLEVVEASYEEEKELHGARFRLTLPGKIVCNSTVKRTPSNATFVAAE